MLLLSSASAVVLPKAYAHPLSDSNQFYSPSAASHKLDEILELTDRVTILRDGKNISTFEKKEYDTSKIIADMIGREISDMYTK